MLCSNKNGVAFDRVEDVVILPASSEKDEEEMLISSDAPLTGMYKSMCWLTCYKMSVASLRFISVNGIKTNRTFAHTVFEM